MKVARALLAALLALVVIAAIVAWTLPAQIAWRFAAARAAPLALAGVGGSVWHGHADAASVFGFELGAVDWTLEPVPLLRGELVVHVVVDGPDVDARGVVTRSADGTAFRDVVLTMPARLAAPALAIPMLDLLGTIEIDVTHAHVSGLWADAAAGSAHWRDAAVAGAAQARFGELEATFASTADGAIAGDVRDRGGPLELSGSFTARLGRYEARARLAPRGDNAQVAEALQYVGQPQGDGSRLLLIEGRPLF